MKSLYAHQRKFLDKNPDKALLVWETGTGKTVAACEWLKKREGCKALVVCPKAIKSKWKRDLKEWGAHADVVSRDEVKKTELKNYGCLVLDEAQDFASPLFDKGRSARATVIYNYIKSHPRANVLLLTATPVRSTPWNIHTLSCYLNIFWPIKEFRETFFYFTDMFGRFHWEKKNGWQRMIRPYVEKIADIVLMSDCADVPKQHSQVINIPWFKKDENALKKNGYQEPSAEWHARHRAEQGDAKFKELERLLNGYRKAIVVCHYRSQIDDYAKRLSETRLVYVLNGSTPEQNEVIQNAREADDCVFIIQASMGAGFDAGEFSVVIFASMSFRYVDFVQMKGRVKRINNLHENIFIHLLAGKGDKAVYNAIQDGKDFDVHEELRIAGVAPNKEQA